MARHDGGMKHRASNSEDRLIKLIDIADTLRRYDTLIKKVSKGSLDVPAFLKEVAMDAALQVVHLMNTSVDDKTRLAAATDVLDRAGHGKTTKHQHSGGITVDHQASKMELINMILSSAKRAGIKTKEETGTLMQARGGETIDVTPKQDVAAAVDAALADPLTPASLSDTGKGEDDE